LWAVVYSGVVSVLLLAGGVTVFKKMERRFADVI
jgi:ABC-type polysaccharide/polyol phosphate export permease